MQITLNAYLAGQKGTEYTESASEAGMFFSLAGHHDDKSRALKIENLDLHG